MTMPTKNLKPPFYNKSLSDFFEFKCNNQSKAQYMLDWLSQEFADLTCSIMYSVPMFKIGKSNICYLQYVRIDDGLELQICFGKGSLIEDRYNLFKVGPKVYKAIIIENLEPEFLNQLKTYIVQSIALNM